MYCTNCGKQIEGNSKFCPYCGGGLSGSDAGSAKDALKRTAGAAMGSVKVIGNSVNGATNGQPQKHTEKANETTKVTTGDVKDKNTSNSFTKKKYRSIIIIAVLLIAVFLLNSLLREDKEGKMAEEIVAAYFSDINIECDIKTVKEVKGSDKTLYVVKFFAEREEGSAVVAILYGDYAEILGVFPKSAYPEMEEFIEQNRDSIPRNPNPT